MPFVRISRDKRGYQYFSLVEPMRDARGHTEARVLYWFRTPPDVKIGRDPFDADTRRELEARYPSLVFDWERLGRTPIPPVPIDWRERRRVEKAARRSQRADEETVENTPNGSNESNVSNVPNVPNVPNVSNVPVDSKPWTGKRRRHRRRGL